MTKIVSKMTIIVTNNPFNYVWMLLMRLTKTHRRVLWF